jgi:hypothetical protein
MHVRARRHQRHRRLCVPLLRGKVQRRVPAQQSHAPVAPMSNLLSQSFPPGERSAKAALSLSPCNAMQAPTVPIVVRAMHVRARRHQRHRRLCVPLLRGKVQRRVPAQQSHAPVVPMSNLLNRALSPGTVCKGRAHTQASQRNVSADRTHRCWCGARPCAPPPAPSPSPCARNTRQGAAPCACAASTPPCCAI